MFSDIHFTAGNESYIGKLINQQNDKTVIVIPDWRGHKTEYAQRRGAELANLLKFNILVGDLYGINYQPVKYKNDAENWITKALEDPNTLRQKLFRYVRSIAEVLNSTPNKISIVGYCLGGALAFEAGRSDIGLDRVICIHGIPSSVQPVTVLNSKTRFLAIHGADDSIVSLEKLTKFQHEMYTIGAPWMSLTIGNARHGFTNEDTDPYGMYQRYDAIAADYSINVVQMFLLKG